MGSQPDNATRFSMCNCITLGLPNTYTAHAMSMDFFIKHVNSGMRISMPYIDLWPKGYVKIYKIPKTINTFLFSSFNEAFYDRYTFDDDKTEYIIGPEGLKFLQHVAIKQPSIKEEEFADRLLLMNQKITEIWGNKVTKIIVEYDSSRALENIRLKIDKYNKLTQKILNWPTISIPPQTNNSLWYKYTKSVKDNLFQNILNIETRT